MIDSLQYQPFAFQASKVPPAISYSLLEIPSLRSEDEQTTSGITKIYLPRRDLYDARFQILAQMPDKQEEEESSHPSEGNTVQSIRVKDQSLQEQLDTLGFVDTPSDLIPNVYEGGLKTWECSLDLVGWLDASYTSRTGGTWAVGKRILEVM